MKRTITTILAVCMVFGMAGCSTEQTSAPAADNTTTTTTVTQLTADSDGYAASNGTTVSVIEAVAGSNAQTSTAEGDTGDQTTGAAADGTQKTAGSKATTTTTEKKATNKTTTTTAKKTTTTTAKQAVKKTTTTTKKATTTKKPTTTTKAASKWDKVATAADAKDLADRVIYYINQYRAAQGSVTATKLPGLTQVAEYRSKQLTANFAHDIDDIHAAYTACKYGEKNANSTYDFATGTITYDGTYYYDGSGQEAIAYDVSWGDDTIDKLAENIAQHYKSSSGHWAYVGATSEYYRNYSYIAIGLTCTKEGSHYRWYSCILVSDTNQYG